MALDTLRADYLTFHVKYMRSTRVSKIIMVAGILNWSILLFENYTETSYDSFKQSLKRHLIVRS